jgi:hypothetical protein
MRLDIEIDDNYVCVENSFSAYTFRKMIFVSIWRCSRLHKHKIGFQNIYKFDKIDDRSRCRCFRTQIDKMSVNDDYV